VAIRLVHAGLGGWGTDWELNALPPVREIERVAWVDSHEPTLEKARQRLELPEDRCFTTLRDAFERVEADAVLITAPMVAHVPLAIEALEAGKHVLVEKPFAGTVAEARTAVDLAAERGLTLMVSQQYRHYPAVRKTEQLITEEAFGSLSTVRVDFRKYSNRAKKGTSRHYLFPHPLIYDMAIHHFDLMRLLLKQEPVRVFAQVMDPPWSKFNDEASAAITIVFDRGTVVSYRGSWVSTGEPTFWAGEWHLECETGEIFFTSREGGAAGDTSDVVRVRPLEGRPREEPLDRLPFHGRSAGLVAFAEAITEGTEPETSGHANLGSVALMEAAAKASTSGRVEDVISPY
jgi:predicted dehydrogenase